MQIVRELKDVVNKVLESSLHSGLQRAREEMRLRPLTAYDVQVQSCDLYERSLFVKVTFRFLHLKTVLNF